MVDHRERRRGQGDCERNGIRVGWKFRCTAAVHRDGPVYEEVMGRLATTGLALDTTVKPAVVLLRIDQVLSLFGEVLQEREEGAAR